jgi:hypothetical protein
MICKPEAVVMGFPAVWANAMVGMTTGVETAAAKAANAVWMIERREDRICENTFSSMKRDVSSASKPALLPHWRMQKRRAGSPARRHIHA